MQFPLGVKLHTFLAAAHEFNHSNPQRLTCNSKRLKFHVYRVARKIFNYSKKHTSFFPVIFLQETYNTRKVENIRTNQWGCEKGSIYFSHGSSDSREGLDYTTEKSFLYHEGRYVIRQAKIQDSSIILFNYYAPNADGAQVTVLLEINDILNTLVFEEDTTILWGGNLNSFFDVKSNADGGSSQLKEKFVCKLITAMSQFDLCDIFRVKHPNDKRFTWRQKNHLSSGDLTIF